MLEKKTLRLCSLRISSMNSGMAKRKIRSDTEFRNTKWDVGLLTSEYYSVSRHIFLEVTVEWGFLDGGYELKG